MKLSNVDGLLYFVPTVICGCLAALCILLIVTSAFLASIQNAAATAVAGLFGLVLTGSLGWLFWRTQRRDLLFTRIDTSADPLTNFRQVERAAVDAKWKIIDSIPGQRLDARTSVLLLSVGERVEIHFLEGDVLVASICDPSVGFSLAGRRHCEENRELVRQALRSDLIGADVDARR